MKLFSIFSDVGKENNRGLGSIIISGFLVMKFNEERVFDEVEVLNHSLQTHLQRKSDFTGRYTSMSMISSKGRATAAIVNACSCPV